MMLDTMLDFIVAVLRAVCDFLMTEPIYYFTGIMVLLAVVFIVRKIIF